MAIVVKKKNLIKHVDQQVYLTRQLQKEKNKKIKERVQAKKVGNYTLADKIREDLSKEGIDIKDEKGTTIWNYK